MSLRKSEIETALYNLLGLEEAKIEDVSDAFFSCGDSEKVSSGYVDIDDSNRAYSKAFEARKKLVEVLEANHGFRAMDWYCYIYNNKIARAEILARYLPNTKIEDVMKDFLERAALSEQRSRQDRNANLWNKMSAEEITAFIDEHKA